MFYLAMCMEKLLQQVAGSGEYSMDMIIKYYEQSGDILLLYLQNRCWPVLLPHMLSVQ